MKTAQDMLYQDFIDILQNNTENEDVIKFIEECEDKDDPHCFWDILKYEFDEAYDIEYEFREGMRTNLRPKTSSRHYEIDVHVSQIGDKWIAWDYYYGGGKHGEPEAFDWIGNARFVECTEKVVTKIEYTFKEVLE